MVVPAVRLLFICNVAWFFRSHRFAIAVEALNRGYEVHLASAFEDDRERAQFEAEGILTHEVPFERSGARLTSESVVLRSLNRLIPRIRPAICHNISTKPVLYGGSIARIYGIPAVNAVSGLGYSYIARGIGAHLRRSVLNTGYRFSLGASSSRLIVQNEDDRSFFVERIGIDQRQVTLIKGSGVDLESFDPARPTTSPALVVLPARMLADKGVREFVEAARILRGKGIGARFALVGGLDPHNRAALSENEIASLTNDGAVEYWGHRTDMPDILAAAQIVCLPSYREGLPKALIEAAAAGRPIVTTDVPGCREVVSDGKNGLLVPPRDPISLSKALERLLSDSALRSIMGKYGRTLAEAQFSITGVVERTLQIYSELT